MQALSAFWDRLKRGPPQSRAKPRTDNRRRLQLLHSYAPDWIFTLALLLIISILTEKAGYKREFSLTDTSLQHTYNPSQRITFGECIVYAGVIPGIIMAVWAVGWRRSVWDWHNSWLGLVLACSITTVITQCVKVTVGRPRPDVISRCQPIEGAQNLAVYGLATMERVCTVTTGHIIDDGFKSFPSGHTSFAFSGLTFLTLYLAGKMHLFDRRGVALKSWIAAAPLLGATLIGVSRSMDYRHHWGDILVGGLLGFAVTLVVYHLYYPPLTSPDCHLPFSPRIPRSDDIDLAAAATAKDGPTSQTHLDDGEETARRPNGSQHVGNAGGMLGQGQGQGYGRLLSRDSESSGGEEQWAQAGTSTVAGPAGRYEPQARNAGGVAQMV